MADKDDRSNARENFDPVAASETMRAIAEFAEQCAKNGAELERVFVRKAIDELRAAQAWLDSRLADFSVSESATTCDGRRRRGTDWRRGVGLHAALRGDRTTASAQAARAAGVSEEAMKSENVEAGLDAAGALAEEACDLCAQAILSWHRNDYAGFVRQMREAVAKLGGAAVAFDAIANECERLTMS